MSLDISPDGRTIIFDLLGHLYSLPITGGTARRLTSGMARHRDPRFSPDGRQLVFISDRGGSENVWIADRDGANARQLSKLHGYHGQAVVSPTWSPDGRSIAVAQKLGAIRPWSGNVPDRPYRRMWLMATYDAETGRMRWISDTTPERARPMLGPAFGTRKDELYAAQDIVADGAFLGHWRIVRVDLTTGRVFPETNGVKEGRAGVRPLVSPNGRFLVYASSSGSHLGFRLRDLQTDRERWLVQEQLADAHSSGDRDLVPGYAFTPDSRSLVAAYGGKVRRIDLASGRALVIPFVAEVERRLGPLVVHQFTLPDTAVRTRSVLQPALSPDGNWVVFSALNRLWLMELPHDGRPAGRPQRLTADSVGELYPAWSPDARWIAYATWRDGEGGALWRVRVPTSAAAPPRAAERLTLDTALYFNPAFSPDGRRVVAVRAATPPERLLLDLSSITRPTDPMLVWVPAAGGRPRSITSLRPMLSSYARYPVRQVYFTADSDRIHVGLTSLRWDGSDQRTAFAVVDRDATVVSAMEPDDVAGVLAPDGRRALLARKFELYEVGRAQGNKGPTETVDTLDFNRAQRQSLTGLGTAARRWGTALSPWVSWSRDGRRVIFQQGGTLFVGNARPDVWTTFERVDVPIDITPDLPHGTLVLRGARIITMRGREVIPRGDLVVRGNRIAAAGPSGRVSIPPGAQIMNMEGTTILPGYVDLHDHRNLPRGIQAEQFWKTLLALAHGVTASRDPSAPMDNDVFTYVERERNGELLAPRLFSTGIPEYGTDPPTNSIEDARAFVRPYTEYFRTETFKLYADRATDRRANQLLAAAAAQSGLNATAHASGLELSLANTIDGVSGIEHAPDTKIYGDVAALIARSGTTQTHTYVVIPGALAYMVRRYGWPADQARIRRLSPPSGRQYTCLSCTGETQSWFGPGQLENLLPPLNGAARIAAQGGSVAMGAHGVVPGLGFHWEMWLHALGGMPNHEILRSATTVGATAIGHTKDFGSLEPGKLADLQVLEKNPLDDIHNTTSIRYVMKNGRLYKADDLTEIWPRNRPLPPIYLWDTAVSTDSTHAVSESPPAQRVRTSP